MLRQTFTVPDYVVFGVTVLLSLGIGVYFAIVGRKKKTTLNYFHGNRQLHYLPVALSLVVTFQSSVMVLGFPAEVYLFGYMIVLFNIGQCLAIFLGSRLIVPMMYPLRITSVYHYLQLRYKNNSVRLLNVIIGILSQSIYMGIVLFGPAIALASVTSLPAWTSILCIAGAAIIYTSIGGILAVIWTDVLQCTILLVGIVATLIKSTVDAGGIARVFDENNKSGRLDIIDFNPDPTVRHTFWTVLTGSFIGSFSLTLSQSCIQRCNSTPNIQDAKKVLYIAGPVFITLQTLSMSLGLVCYAYYSSIGCDPIRSGKVTNPNQIVPFMIGDIFRSYPGLSGMFISALFSASLSTLSSILGGLSAITVEDLIRPYFKLSDACLTVIAKVSVLAYGVIGIGVAFGISQLEGSLTQILFSIMGAATGPSVGIFFLSMFYQKATDKGAIVGGLVGLVVAFWICIGSNVTPAVPRPTQLKPPSILYCNVSSTVSAFSDSNMTTTYVPTTFAEYVNDQNSFRYTNLSSDLNVKEGILTTSSPHHVEELGILDRMYTLSYALFSTLGTVVTLIVGLAVSTCTYNKNRDSPDPKYVMSLTDQIRCCFKRGSNATTKCTIIPQDDIQMMPNDEKTDTEI